MQSLDERLAELRGQAAARVNDAAMCRRKAGDFEHEAMVLEAEIRGIETARAALQPQADNGAVSPRRHHKKRRDVKALVRDLVNEMDPSVPFTSAHENQIAQQVGCKPYRVRAIVEALRKDAAG